MNREMSELAPIALTIADAARQLAVSQMTIRRLLDSGALAKVSLGRAVRVLAQSVRELAERGGVSRGK